MNIVNNKFPKYSSPYRIAIIGEAPGKDEEHFGEPFIGASGRFLAALLSRAGVSRDQCYLGNVSQHRPPNNDIASFNWSGEEIQDGLHQLKLDMQEFKPNICVLLGNVPLKAAKDATTSHKLLPKSFMYKNSNWRGSLFFGQTGPFENLKCLCTYHPAYALRDYEVTPLIQFDLRKAVREASSPLLVLPNRNLVVNGDSDYIISRLREIRTARRLIALDIEGGIDTMSCISFATSPTEAFIIPITAGTDAKVWRELALTLEDPYVPKVLQNSLYDRFVLAYSYGIRVRGVTEDTMLKHWELYSELEKSLGVQASLYTDEPYYKFERKSDDVDVFYRYCCKDSCVTYEISGKLDAFLSGSSLSHYRFNIGLLNPLLYMELRGIRYDVSCAQQRRDELKRKLMECQAKFNALTGYGFSFKTKAELIARRDALMLTVKKDRPLKAYEEEHKRFNELLFVPEPNLSTIGELETICEVGLNVDSSKQFIPYLYETLKLPTQYKIERSKETDIPTADYEALLKLSRWCLQNGKDREHQIVQAPIEIRSLGTREQMLGINADNDGRIRCGYNLVGTNTGRISCYESPTGSGYNLQTIPNYTEIKDAPGGVLGDRDLFITNEDHWFFQCDLSGADGWTYAAYCAMLGDSKMLDEYRLGIKPYARIALKLKGDPMADCKDAKELKAYLKTRKLGDQEKLTAKRVQHGGAYLEGGLTISRNVLKDSEGKLYIAPSECDRLKRWYTEEMYWGLPKWQRWVADRLKERPVLTAASGQVRQFFGRPDEILTKAVAFEPQANTTYATNLAAWRLWSDNDNRSNGKHEESNGVQPLRVSDIRTLPDMRPCRLRIEPLHQVHDALCGQFKKEDTTWAIGKIQSYFNNTLMIAGQQIIIPYEGRYGKSWGDLEEGTI